MSESAQDEFSEPIEFMSFEEGIGTVVTMGTVWHLYPTGKESAPPLPLVFSTEEAARRAAVSMLKAEFRGTARWEPSSSCPGGYEFRMRVYGGKKYTPVCSIAPAPVHGWRQGCLHLENRQKRRRRATAYGDHDEGNRHGGLFEQGVG